MAERKYFDPRRYTSVYPVNKLHPYVITKPQRFNCQQCNRLVILQPGLSLQGALSILERDLHWTVFTHDNYETIEMVCSDIRRCYTSILVS